MEDTNESNCTCGRNLGDYFAVEQPRKRNRPRRKWRQRQREQLYEERRYQQQQKQQSKESLEQLVHNFNNFVENEYPGGKEAWMENMQTIRVSQIIMNAFFK